MFLLSWDDVVDQSVCGCMWLLTVDCWACCLFWQVSGAMKWVYLETAEALEIPADL